MRTTRIEVQLFGGLRAFAPSGILAVEVIGDGEVTARELKRAAVLAFEKDASVGGGAAGWVAASVVATDDRILSDDEHVPLSAALAFLPPVNGG